MQLSKLEYKAYQKLKESKLNIFKIGQLVLLLNIDKTSAYNLIKALKKKKAIVVLQNGTYSLNDIEDFAIGPYVNWPSYLSFWSALSYYKLTDQMPKKIFLASTRYKRDNGVFKYVLISKKRFFGYQLIGDIIIADKEKAIIDSLLLPKYSGGIREIMNAVINSLGSLDLEKLTDYAIKMDSKAVVRRLGFILEGCKIKKYKLKRLMRNIGKGYEKLDPTRPKMNKFNKTWLLDVNIP